MAQDGDTITYTFSDGSAVEEDIASIDELTIVYLDGSGGDQASSDEPAGSGGQVTNVVADVSDYDTIYVWVAEDEEDGRYAGQPSSGFRPPLPGAGAGSTEVSVSNPDVSNTDTAPFIAAAGGGGGASISDLSGSDGARGRSANGTEPPLGGEGAPSGNNPGGDGEGSVSGHNSPVTILESGTTTTGGGSGSNTHGEVRIAYMSNLSPPDPPSNLSAEVQ